MQIELTQILLQVLNFGILFFVLAKFLFKPILKILDARADRVAEAASAAEKSLKMQAEIEEKKAAKLAEATKKAAAVMAEAREDAKKMAAEIVAEAKAASAKEVEKQQAAFMDALHEEELAMKRRVVTMVVATTKTVLAESLPATEVKAITKKELARLK